MPENRYIYPERRVRIIKLSSQLFSRYGYKRVTVDELVTNLHISKTTFYKVYKTKEDLLADIVEYHFVMLSRSISRIIRQATGNYIDQLYRLLELVSQKLNPLGSLALEDIRTSVPTSWERIKEHQQQIIISSIEMLLQKGIEANLVRQDVNPSLTAQIMLMMIKNTMKVESIRELSASLQDVFRAVVTILFQGIETDHGRLCYDY